MGIEPHCLLHRLQGFHMPGECRRPTLTNRLLSAQEACAWGIVTRVMLVQGLGEKRLGRALVSMKNPAERNGRPRKVEGHAGRKNRSERALLLDGP